jgi:hypothetical protein
LGSGGPAAGRQYRYRRNEGRRTAQMILVRWKVRYQVTRQGVAKSVGGRVGEDVTLYDLRHFHASGLPARGGHVVTV